MKDTTEWVIFGSGPSVSKYRWDIEKVLPDRTVVCVNYRPDWVEPDYHVICNRRNYKKYRHTIHPKSVFVGASKVKGKLYFKIDNDYSNKHGMYHIDGRIGGATVSMVAAAFAISRGASTLLFVGLDGFTDPQKTHWYRREKNFGRCLWQTEATRNILRDMSKYVNIKIHTPTVYGEWYEPF